MAAIEGLSSLLGKLGRLASEARPVSVFVAYSASYAVFVHEDLEAKHAVGNAKFLEGPARRMADELGGAARRVYEETGSMERALLTAGLLLQGASQRECPVDKGLLRASATTEVEKQNADR